MSQGRCVFQITQTFTGPELEGEEQVGDRVCVRTFGRRFFRCRSPFSCVLLAATAFLVAVHGETTPLATKGGRLTGAAHFKADRSTHDIYLADRSGGVCAHLATRHAMVEVPEPAPLLLVGAGLLSIAVLIRNRRVREK
jgi:hypothetical protein